MNRNDDQWFSPGDKCMRVSNACELRLPHNDILPKGSETGKVVCVVEFKDNYPIPNFVRFAGFEGWFYAANFRRVEEIQLCVKAAEQMKAPKKQEVEV